MMWGLTGCGVGFIPLCRKKERERKNSLKVRASVISRSRYLPSVCCGFLSRALKQKHYPSVDHSRDSTPGGDVTETPENERQRKTARAPFSSHRLIYR